jgi:aspartokinase/homoserine dehydrogenase 1
MSVVLKIGGSNLRDIDSLKQIELLIRKYDQPVFLVVSAFNGLTDKLYDQILPDSEKSVPLKDFISELQTKYESIIKDEIIHPDIRKKVLEEFNRRIIRLDNLLKGSTLIGAVPDFIEDEVVSFGERFSSLIIAAYLEQKGLNARELLPEDVGIFTDGILHNSSVDFEKTRQGFRNLDHQMNYIIPGFYGISDDRRINVFGRGGSDYSAAAIAACVGAESLDVWKDVDGYLSGDPSLVSEPKQIRNLSYREAAELSYFGAKILHPRTVEPLKPLNIPIRIFNFNQIEGEISPYTVIGKQEEGEFQGIKSVTFTEGIRTLTLRGAGVGITPGILSKVAHQLEINRLNIKSVITTQIAISLLLNSKDLKRASDLISAMQIQGIDELDSSEELCLVAAVGEGVLIQPGVAARIFTAVANHGINIQFISFGASKVAIYFLVERDSRDKALNAIHTELFC